MRLDRKHLLLFVAFSLVFAAVISLSGVRAVHAVLITNLEAPARARTDGIVQSMSVGLRDGSEDILATYLRGCLGAFGASYAAALDERGGVRAVESVSSRARASGTEFEDWRPAPGKAWSREASLDGRRTLELVMPAAGGALLLGFDLEDALRTERQVAVKIFLFSGTTAGLALVLLAWLMRELGRREEQLRQADKLSAVGRLAAGIAHEINNPLGSILGFAQAAAARLKAEDPLMPPLKAIEEEALRCRNLVRNLLTFSRTGRDEAAAFELAPAVEGTLSMIEAQARDRGVLIVREFEEGVRTLGERGQIQQVVMNLCTNAVDAMPEGGRLTIRSGSLNGGKVYFEVEDQGTGIPEDIRDRIFEPFFTTKDVGKGTGLGLSLVHEILLRHQGTVEASFPAAGGSRFRVTLAAAVPAAG